jgi:hypothetical protein
VEKAALQRLPLGDVEGGEWKEAKLHPRHHGSVEGNDYSAPPIHRHTRIKLTETQVEIFLELERVAIHPPQLPSRWPTHQE